LFDFRPVADAVDRLVDELKKQSDLQRLNLEALEKIHEDLKKLFGK